MTKLGKRETKDVRIREDACQELFAFVGAKTALATHSSLQHGWSTCAMHDDCYIHGENPHLASGSTSKPSDSQLPVCAIFASMQGSGIVVCAGAWGVGGPTQCVNMHYNLQALFGGPIPEFFTCN